MSLCRLGFQHHPGREEEHGEDRDMRGLSKPQSATP
jgi:hypothetical protein